MKEEKNGKYRKISPSKNRMKVWYVHYLIWRVNLNVILLSFQSWDVDSTHTHEVEFIFMSKLAYLTITYTVSVTAYNV